MVVPVKNLTGISWINVSVGKPYFLSGGIAPDDVALLKSFAAQPEAKGWFAIDINSKFETSVRIKNLDKVEQFIQAF